MALDTELMALGLQSGPARAIGSNINLAVAAAGSSQTTATVLVNDYNVVTTGSGGVMLIPAGGASENAVVNQLGGNCTVYPQVGQTIYGAGNVTVNVGVVIPTNKTGLFSPCGNGWVCNISA
jgi:hypothetical protein